MQRKSFWMLFTALTVVSMLLSACTPTTPAAPAEPIIQTVIVQGTPMVITATPAPTDPPAAPEAAADLKVINMAVGANDLPSIDPSHAVSLDEVQIIISNSIGLVRQNVTTAEVEKGMATDYKISEDGKTITFTIRDDVPWVKYDANQDAVVKVQDCDGKDRLVTAEDYKYGILRTLNPATASEYAYVLDPYLVGADAYNNPPEDADEAKMQELADAVGVKVIDNKTIEYTFNQPGVYNLNILGLWVAHAQPKWLIEGDDCNDARGERWTETGFYQGYGPFTLKEWVHDSNITVIKNPFWPGTPEVPQAKIDEIIQKFIDVTASLADYEAGNLDMSGIPSGDYDRIMNDPVMKEQVRQVITIGTEFYAFNTKLAPTDDMRVRKALSLAIDRQSLIDNVVKNGIVAHFFTNPGAQGAPKIEKYPDLGVKFDPTQAKALLDEYLKEKNITADQLNITLLSNATESRKKAGEAIIGMWKQNLGIDVKFTTQETKVYYVSRRAGAENVYRMSWVQDYPDANNFLYEPFSPNGGFADVVDWPVASSPDKPAEYQTGGDPVYDQFLDLLVKAAVEQDPAKRMDLYAEAEKVMVQDESVVAPLYWYSTPYLIRPEIKDTPAITGYDSWEWWDVER